MRLLLCLVLTVLLPQPGRAGNPATSPASDIRECDVSSVTGPEESQGGSPDGAPVFVNDGRARTTPSSTRAWWRFEEGAGVVATEETGRFFAGTYAVYSGEGWTSAPDALGSMFTGVDAVPDRYARLNTNVDALTPNTVITAIDWTLELIVRLAGYQSCTFFEWAATRPPDTTTGTWINVEWVSGSQTLSVRLRCDGRTSAVHESELFIGLPRDGQWHHVALVKNGSQLFLYVDYEIFSPRTISASASGNYSFDTLSRAYIGQDYSGGGRARGGIGFDEIRFSDGVFIEDFLRVDEPFFTAPPKVNATSADVTFVGTPWLPSLIERRASLQSGTWTSCGTFAAAAGYIGKTRTVNVPKPSTDRGFYRIR